ncbi:hypothetical protein FRC18_004469 [Serendipita sp. 400]|nr:hypothetical protein FRC18_004469 [Serendipita sp. 400]
MSTAGVSNQHIQDVFDLINTSSNVFDFFNAILSCPLHSRIRHIRNQLTATLPKVMHKIVREDTMPEYIISSAVLLGRYQTSWPLMEKSLPELPDKLSGCQWLRNWSYNLTKKTIRQEMQNLINQQSGLHSNASTTTMDKIRQFTVADLGDKIEKQAPFLWDLVESLSAASRRRTSERLNQRRTSARLNQEGSSLVRQESTSKRARIEKVMVTAKQPLDTAEDSESDFSDTYSISGDIDDAPLCPLPDSSAVGKTRRRVQDPAEILKTKRHIKTVAVLSLLAHSNKERANTLQVALGMLLKINHATDKVVPVFNSIGLSVSNPTIEQMVTSISLDAEREMKELCATGTAAVIYDNINFSQRKAQATLNSDTTFASMTAATFVPCQDTSPEKLKYTRELWANNPINPHRDPNSTYIAPSYPRLFLSKSPDGLPVHDSVRSDIEFIIARIILNSDERLGDLAMELERSFVPLYQVPLIKTELVPARTMDYDEGTQQGNASVFADIRRQDGLTEEQAEYIMLHHCDMASLIHAHGVQMRRRREETPLSTRALHVLPVPGHFPT